MILRIGCAGKRRSRQREVALRDAMGNTMLTLEDCIAYCDLTEEEVLAIAEHEHLPEMAAIAYGQYLLRKDEGTAQIFKIIVEDIRSAQHRNDREHVQTLLHVLHHFVRSHPEVAPAQHPWHTIF